MASRHRKARANVQCAHYCISWASEMAPSGKAHVLQILSTTEQQTVA